MVARSGIRSIDRRYWQPAISQAGVAPLRPHDLRHTAVALWIATGANPLEVSRRAGHTSANFTKDRYGHLFPEADEAVADRLDALITSIESQRPATAVLDIHSNSDGRKTDEVSDSDADVLRLVAPEQGESEWALRDSNPRPQPCESVLGGLRHLGIPKNTQFRGHLRVSAITLIRLVFPSFADVARTPAARDIRSASSNQSDSLLS